MVGEVDESSDKDNIKYEVAISVQSFSFLYFGAKIAFFTEFSKRNDRFLIVRHKKIPRHVECRGILSIFYVLLACTANLLLSRVADLQTLSLTKLGLEVGYDTHLGVAVDFHRNLHLRLVNLLH